MTMGIFLLLNSVALSTLGSPVLYEQPGDADAFTVNGILQRETDEERHIDGLYARLFVQLADFAVPPEHGDRVTIGAVTYTVFEVQTDANGGAYLKLRVS